MDNKSVNHSKDNVDDTSKRNSLLDRIKHDPKNNYGSYAALIGVLLTIFGMVMIFLVCFINSTRIYSTTA